MPSKTEDTATATPTLGEEINIAIRPLHTKLNKLVTRRLRLALPPHSDDAKNYVTGLLHITPIYQTFEREWDHILEDSHNTTTKVEPRIRSLLADIRVEGFARSGALQEDIATLLGRNDDFVRSRMESVSHAPVLVEFKKHIREAVEARPHVLVAYAWVMYMALFAGGRFIRASLERVDQSTGFWSSLESPSSDKPEPEFRIPGAYDAFCVKDVLRKQNMQPPPLNFFLFKTPENGEDLKRSFKEALAAATSPPESKLTEEECADVKREGLTILEYMVRIVGELDELCGTEYEEQAAAAAVK
ncbi:heme oxygenase-like protein [Daldinia vernicosa]|uniref:heme oxygenase-like protein n=1 Tax=Daldinia vernicosa TaxID=114800 RepID=UPI0020079B64|nr:heme oxygenase-like protein [Daldinia vernicosa]KAI0849071.1 heme oxygenase-like protein [Daldinia vernicosa]